MSRCSHHVVMQVVLATIPLSMLFAGIACQVTLLLWVLCVCLSFFYSCAKYVAITFISSAVVLPVSIFSARAASNQVDGREMRLHISLNGESQSDMLPFWLLAEIRFEAIAIQCVSTQCGDSDTIDKNISQLWPQGLRLGMAMATQMKRHNSVCPSWVHAESQPGLWSSW